MICSAYPALVKTSSRAVKLGARERRGSWGDSKKGAGRVRNSKVELMGLVGGW